MKKKVLKRIAVIGAVLTVPFFCFACAGGLDGSSSSNGSIDSIDSSSSLDSGDGEDVVPEEDGIEFTTLSANGLDVFGKVENARESFSFADEIVLHGNAKFVVALDEYGVQTVVTRTIPLEIGDNSVYVIEMVDDEVTNVYSVTIRRRPTYTVKFDSMGAGLIETQIVEEDSFAVEPIPERPGYTFMGWDFDFSVPILRDYTFTAQWEINKNTPYVVEYYLQNAEDSSYTLDEAVSKTGTTNVTVKAMIKEYTHFTLNKSKSKTEGKISPDGTLVLKLYYDISTYRVTVVPSGSGTVTPPGSYKYGTAPMECQAQGHLGYDFLGWYDGDELLSAETTYLFEVDKNITAKFAPKAQMADFTFNSTIDSCEITGVVDNSKKALVIPDFVTSIGYSAFSGCSSLTSVVIGDSVTSIGDRAFYNCSSLTSVVIPDGVTSIGYSAFSGCSSLEEITIPFVGGTRKTASDTYQYPFGYIFGTSSYTGGTATEQTYYGSSTSSTTSTTYYIPISLKKVTVTGGEILYGAFYNCSSLTSVVIGDGVTSIGEDAFYNCSKLKYNEYDNAYYLGNENNPYLVLVKAKSKDITSCNIHEETKFIINSAFQNCSSLTSVVIPDSVTSIGDSAFSGCSNLIDIYITDIGAWCGIEGLSDLMQYGAWNKKVYVNNEIVTEIIIPDGVTRIPSYAFYKWSNLTSVVIPDGVTSIGEYAFAYCRGLTSVVIPDSVTSIGDYAFAYCSSLTSVEIPDGVTSIGERAFYNCSSLTSVEIPDGVTSIGSYAFYQCSSLTSVVIPNNVTSIGDYAFGWCSSLTSVVIPDSVTSIGYGAFFGCSSLTSVEIGDSVTSIGERAFYNCSSLTSVTFENLNGWWRASSSTATSGTAISSADLSNASTAATYLKSTYSSYYWKRS